MRAFLWIDTETTGLNSSINDIIQIACIPIINGVEYKPFNEFCQPLNYDAVDAGAIAIHGITVERMRKFQSSSAALEKFKAYLSSIQLPDGIKFTLAGYNVGFDKGFLSAMFGKLGQSAVYRTLFNSEVHDTMHRAKLAKGLKQNPKLSKLAEEYGISINAHEALSDIRATIEVDKLMAKALGDEDVELFNHVTDKTFPHPAYLHLHSEFSNTDSVSTVEDWVRWAINNNAKFLSFPDHNWAASLFKATNIKSVIDKINKQDKTKHPYDVVTLVPSISINISHPNLKSPFFRVNAWATSNEGYQNLLKISSTSWNTTYNDSGYDTPVISMDDFAQLDKDGVVFGTGCERGLVGSGVVDSLNLDDINAIFNTLIDSLGSSELLIEYIPFDIQKQFRAVAGFTSYKRGPLIEDGNLAAACNRILWDIQKTRGLKAIVSTMANYIHKDDFILQQIVSKSSYKDGRYYYESRHQRRIEECFATINAHVPEFNEEAMLKAISNSITIAEASKNISIKYDYHLPKIEIPGEILAKTDNYDKQLYYLLMAKIKEHGRWSDDPVYVQRFKKELDVIWKNSKLNFLPYFLVYEDIGSFARSQGILQNIARGSAGGCLLSYYLKIIHVDPIKEDLPFERFLSHARINANSFPDIDADFGVRVPILSYLKEKYNLGFAQIGTIQKFKTKNALKEVMYALYHHNRAHPAIMDICETIPDSPQGLDEHDFLYGYTDSEGVTHKGHIEDNQALQAFFKQYDGAEDVIRRLIGLPRSLGRHASGFVVSTLDLGSSRVPTMTVNDAEIGPILVTQFEAPMVDKCGLVKADILGVTTIKTIAECIKLIKDRTGKDLLEEDDKGVQYIYRLPDDKGVYKDFYNKKTDSSFQFNTSLIKGYITSFAPSRRKDLADLTALCRPGALDVEFLPGISATQFYLKVRNGECDPVYIHPDVEPILKDTYGVVVYQEQLMRLLVELCGYSLEESDQIRSAIAKKKRDVMVKAFERVRNETSKRGWTKEQADKICDVLTAYSNYSFNKSHSCAYAELGYITMWLKHNYPLEWWTSELNNSEEDKMRHYVSLLGRVIVPPTLTTPSSNFTIVGNRISTPLTAIKGLGPASIKNIVDNGPYQTLEEFIQRVNGSKVNLGHAMALIRSRAMDDLMIKGVPYAEARLEIVNRYRKIKNTKSKTDEMFDVSPLNIFFQERDTSRCFNRTLLQDEEVSKIVTSTWDFIIPNQSRIFPFVTRGVTTYDSRGRERFSESTPILANVQAAAQLIDAGRHEDETGNPIEVGFIGFFQSSSFKSGISKKSGREWNKVDVIVSDGLSVIECVKWDNKRAYGFTVNSIVFIRGTLRKGWKGDPQLTINEIECISDWSKRAVNSK